MGIVCILFGAIVGLSLGLTGGGGAILAVPLLVYGVGVPAREAVLISLAAVGASAWVGFVMRWRAGEVELRPGLLFAIAGMLGAPIGSWLASLLPESALLLSFGVLMIVIAVRLWRHASLRAITDCPPADAAHGPSCRRDESGVLRLTSRCAAVLSLVGLGAGVLSGLYGVGGGFIIVPALMLFSRMPLRSAIGTSLMVVSLVSAAGIASQLATGRTAPFAIVLPFLVGGVAGLLVGQRLARRLSGPVLQRTFVVIVVCIAVFVIVRNLTL